ncbi:hypothetical protein [Microseira sp. BLCC-F43]|jgi:hypothetical protein|uniref:hypothetical protein n=1 Tax=Microseira sp. BLCC-F43 TaxID=3153602 RepID=UPI0035B80437
MSKIIYDLIQRFEVENGVPRLISTNIQVIQGGEDLMSLATNLLAQLGFYDKFEEKRTSQYIGYRLKNPGKGDKRYQIVLSPRQDGLCISISKNVLQPHILELKYYAFVVFYNDTTDYEMIILGSFWVFPSQEKTFIKTFNYPEVNLNYQTKGRFYFHWTPEDLPSQEYPYNFDKNQLAERNSYLILDEDKLFPYTLQTFINSVDALEEFIGYFGKIIMEQQ